MSATATESVQFKNIAATTAAFALKGGKYSLIVTATFGGGNLQLQALALDGTTWITLGGLDHGAGGDELRSAAWHVSPWRHHGDGRLCHDHRRAAGRAGTVKPSWDACQRSIRGSGP